jgi:thymidylate synthase
MFLGVPFNVASYAILTHMVAILTGYTALEFTHFIADAHVYNTHFDAVRIQLSRDPKQYPTLTFDSKCKTYETLHDFKFEDFKIEKYEHCGIIKAQMAI